MPNETKTTKDTPGFPLREADVNLPGTESSTPSTLDSCKGDLVGKTGTWHWTASRVPLPAPISTGDSTYASDAVIWMDGDQYVRHFDLLEPGDELAQILKSFEKVINFPAEGDLEAPESLRTDCKDFIELLSPLYPDIEFIHGVVPEIQEMIGDVEAALENDTTAVLPVGNSPESVKVRETISEFYLATAALYKFTPWKRIDRESNLISLTINALGIHNRVITIISRANAHPGLLIHESITDLDRYMALVTTGDQSSFEKLPPFMGLSFVNDSEVSENSRKQRLEHGWKLANPKAHPQLFIGVDNGHHRPPVPSDYETVGIICKALIELFKNNKNIKNYWKEESVLSWNTLIDSTNGSVDVLFQVPALPPGKQHDSLNLFEKMWLLDRTSFADVERKHQWLVDALSQEYKISPEAKSIKESRSEHALLMNLVFAIDGVTIASLTPPALEDFLYRMIPATATMDITESASVIEECRAFIQFLKRVYQFGNADELCNVLDQKAVQKLQSALSHDSDFGIGKPMLSSLPSEEPGEYYAIDMDAFDEPVAPIKELSAAEKKKRKNKRKKARKSRQRNR